MIKQIAVIMGAINMDNQRLMLEGMEAAAREADCNLFVFTNYVGTRETVDNIVASYQVLKLPDFKQFDGIILVGNTVHHPLALEMIIQQMHESKKPLVSIDRHFDGMSCVEIYSYDAEYEMVEHFLYHGYTKICYITGGLETSRDAQLRLLAFKDAMRVNGVEYDPGDIYEGQFTYESGVAAAKKILAEGKHPEAIICANDDMAHGAMRVFHDAGYQIPEDIKFAGFDNGEFSTLNKPTLTTVDKNQYEVGYRSVYEVMELLSGKDLDTYRIPCKIEYRESCGCMQGGQDLALVEAEYENLKRKYVAQQMDTIRMSDLVRNMTYGFSRAHTPAEIVDVIRDNIAYVGVEEFYLCLCDRDEIFVLPERNLGQNIDIQQIQEDYTPLIEIPLVYQNGTYTSFGKFPKGMVLPQEYRERKGGNTYVVNQIFYQDFCYGYAVCKRVDSIVASGIYYSMLMEIGIGLENARKWMLLKDAMDKLNGMWCYDNLTHLYNRSGFFYEAKTLIDNFRHNQEQVFIIFMDADGLKKANDTYGHESGDVMIRQIGGVVHENVSREMLGMRYGGDEFVLFGGIRKGEEYKLDEIVDSIQNDIKAVNESGKFPFQLSVSIGVSYGDAIDTDNLSVLIEQADKSMYEEKRRKKSQKA